MQITFKRKVASVMKDIATLWSLRLWLNILPGRSSDLWWKATVPVVWKQISKNCEAMKLPRSCCKELSLTTSCLRSSTENDFPTRFLLVIIKRTFLELAWKRSEHLIVSEAPNNKTAKTNYHTKPRTKNSAEEATTENMSVIYGIGHPVMYHQINNGKRLLNNSFVLTW